MNIAQDNLTFIWWICIVYNFLRWVIHFYLIFCPRSLFVKCIVKYLCPILPHRLALFPPSYVLFVTISWNITNSLLQNKLIVRRMCLESWQKGGTGLEEVGNCRKTENLIETRNASLFFQLFYHTPVVSRSSKRPGHQGLSKIMWH